jgi:GTP1/Obg family GTP-binding protein
MLMGTSDIPKGPSHLEFLVEQVASPKAIAGRLADINKTIDEALTLVSDARNALSSLQIEQKLTDCEARLRAMKVAAAAEAKNTTILATRLQDWLTRTVSAVEKLGETN